MSYQPVPVQAAAEVSNRFDKAVVVIISWDRKFNLIHTTTYGQSANDKLSAAALGDLLAAAAGADLSRRSTDEDFRSVTAAEWAQQKDKLVKACHGAHHLITSLLAVREGPTDELLRDVQKAINDALVSAGAGGSL